MLHTFVLCLFVMASVAMPSLVLAQQQDPSVYYAYDENGRLRAVIQPNGEKGLYKYDEVGNLTAIQRLEANEVELISFSPHEGAPGDLVTFNGVGFSGITAVSFNSVTARIVQVIDASVVAEVPQGATTGTVALTTPRGTLTTPEPFTVISRVQISPVFTSLLPDNRLQFKAAIMPASGDQRVTWSVNGIEGGNAIVGTITPSGIYTVPTQPPASPLVNIRATSITEPSQFGRAEVTLLSRESTRLLFSSAVAVRYGSGPLQASPISEEVSIRRGSPLAISGLSSAPLSIRYDSRSAQALALSEEVAIQRGAPLGISGLSSVPLSVRLGSAVGSGSARNSPVSVTTGPYISAVSPMQVPRGTTTTLTLTGANLGGATALRFIKADGVLDSSVAVSDISVGADGTSLTAAITVSGSTSPGERTVVVSTEAGPSLGVRAGANTIEVIP